MSVGSTNFPGSLDTALDLVEVANKASTTVSGGTLSSGNTTVTVASTASFTSSGIIGIDDELIAYTGKTATTFTGCTRAFESTTAASHADGAAVKQYITAASHNVQSAAIIAIETKVGSGSSTPAVNTVLAGSGTGTSAWGQVTNAMLAGSIQASKLVGTDIATVGTITSGTLSTGTVLGGVTVTLGSDATGDIYYRNSGGVLTRLGIGTTGQVLTVASGLPSWATASGSGTVTSVSVTTANGISGTVANATTTPAITLTLGAITPTSVNGLTLTAGATGWTIAGGTTSKTLTLSNTLTLAGTDGSTLNVGAGGTLGTAAFTAATAYAAAGAVTSSGLTMATARLLGRSTASTGAVEEITIGSGLTLSAGTLTASGGGGTPAGSAGQVQFNSAGSFGGAAGFTYQSGASPNVTITAQAGTYVALSIVSASTPTIDVFRVSADNGTTTHFRITSSGSPSSPGAGANSERYGAGALASAADSVAFGSGASSTLGAGVAIGRSSTAEYSGVAVGNSATAGNHSIAIGQSTTASLAGSHTVVVGRASSHSGTAGMLIGGDSASSGNYNIAIGYNAVVSHTGSIVLGSLGAVSTAANQMVCGSSSYPIDNVFFGKGVTNTSPTAATISGTGGSGSNSAGANLIIAGGIHTGTPAFTTPTGHVILSTSTVGAAASTANSLVQRFIVNGARKALTDATNVNLFEVALPSLTGCAGAINFEIFAADATDTQVRRGSVQYSAVNKGGTYTTEIAVVSEAASVSAGTLTATWSILNGTNKITIRVNADTSLTPTTFYCVYTLENNSQQAITVV